MPLLLARLRVPSNRRAVLGAPEFTRPAVVVRWGLALFPHSRIYLPQSRAPSHSPLPEHRPSREEHNRAKSGLRVCFSDHATAGSKRGIRVPSSVRRAWKTSSERFVLSKYDEGERTQQTPLTSESPRPANVLQPGWYRGRSTATRLTHCALRSAVRFPAARLRFTVNSSEIHRPLLLLAV